MSRPARVYVASSWRNELQPWVVEALRLEGMEVYDFRAPDPGGDVPGGFQWSDIDPSWTGWDARTFREQLEHPTAQHGFDRDMGALRWCDACLLILPCGRSAHLELGWAAGAGKRTAAYLVDGEPELMYRMVDDLLVGAAELASWARTLRPDARPDAAAETGRMRRMLELIATSGEGYSIGQARTAAMVGLGELAEHDDEPLDVL